MVSKFTRRDVGVLLAASMHRSVDAGEMTRLPPVTVAEVAALTVPAAVMALRTSGFRAGTSRGAARYKRVATEPQHALKLRTRDRWLPDGKDDPVTGGWWEIDEEVVDLWMAGAIGDGVADDGPAILDAYLWAGLGTTAERPFGKKIRLARADYRVRGVLTLNLFGVQFEGESGARLVRRPGDFAVLAVQGDRSQFHSLEADWGWSQGSKEVFGSHASRPAIFYVSGNDCSFDALRLRNAPGNAVQVDGMQRLGVRQDAIGSPMRVAYGPSACGKRNRFTDIDIEETYYAGIAQYWANDTAVVRPRIHRTGAEALTFDTYSTGYAEAVDFAYNVLPGRGGGVGAIGIDSGHGWAVRGGVIRDTGYIGGFTAGIHILGLENSTIDGFIENLAFIDVSGTAIYLSSDVAGRNSVAGPANEATSPKRVMIKGCAFVNCGNARAFRSTAAAANGGALPPHNIAVWLHSTLANPMSGIVAADDNRLNCHVVLDAVRPDWTNDPRNPNGTVKPQRRRCK